ncbi:tetranectin-like protein isoform X2 [Alosa alosa]|uniref:tetranectin-like protein isoform X2 n=1 Tax=Alosa sapidissima TaxID=34773 RepID=UPI001C0A39C0|nr:tetranectin-like protein isoform X2 [Alosa sapidissima]XP_048119294.1 tetranectin-like protein isoform X2 [Alosa alosa]
MMMACPKLLVLLLVVCTALLQHGDARPSRSRKAAPGRQRDEEDMKVQIDKLWLEVNSLKEMQALQTVCLRGIKAYRKCYLAIEEPKHYHEANEDCIAQGGTLAIPRDMQENNDLREYAKRSSPGAKDFWIGVTDIVKEGQYVDVNSMPVTFFNWDKSKKQPTGGKRVSCVTLSLAAQGRWHDEVCRSQKKYICEYLIP